jgi:hypothetical protein
MKEAQTVWTYRGIMYAPHFHKKGYWVSPGYPRTQRVEFSSDRLRKLGAIRHSYPLFAKP